MRRTVAQPTVMLTGIALKLASTVVGSFMQVLVKIDSGGYPLSEIVFFRCVPSLFVVAIWLIATGRGWDGLKTRAVRGHLMRSTWGVASMFLSFASFGLLPLSNATAIGYSSPLIIVVLAAVILRERVRLIRWSAVVVGLMGVVVMLWDSLKDPAATAEVAAGAAALGVGLGLGASALGAVAQIQTRRLVRHESPSSIVFYLQSLGAVAGFGLLVVAALVPDTSVLAHQRWIMPTGWHWLALIGLGIFGGLSQIWVTLAYRHADASVVACFDYATLLWSLMFGFLLFGDEPTVPMLTGALVVAGSGILVIWRERYLAARGVPLERGSVAPAPR